MRDALRFSKRLLVGRPLRTEQMGQTLLPKRLALPVFCSDPLSSNAYATEEILLALSLGGLALFHLAPWVALAVIVLLAVIVVSYRQTCRAYPSGGGAYTVSRENLGVNASLTAASALLVDYVLTVAVSVAAGVANVVSAAPSLSPYAVQICLAAVALLAMVNLRGVRESGRIFAIPTYGFVVVAMIMILWGVARTLLGDRPRATSAGFGIEGTHGTTGWLALALVLRAFSQGCTALTGVEAVSNGVPYFRRPKGKNAADTLAIMGAITIAIFAGITVLALVADVRIAASPGQLIGAPAGYQQKTVIAQVAAAVSGEGSWLFFLVAGFTAAILVLAANTAFNGFPVLASILGADGHLARQFSRRGDRLVFSNGIIILGVGAGVLIWVFDASPTRLIQLYIIGVFVSFTLSQTGMVRHWTTELAAAREEGSRADLRRIRRARLINACGMVITALVLVVVLVTKFTHGAWIVVIAIPLIFVMMKGIHRHYARLEGALRPPAGPVALPSRIHAVVLVNRYDTPTMQALAFARATHPSTLNAVAVRTSAAEIEELEGQWSEHAVPVPLTVLNAPYRDITDPVLDYVERIHRRSPRDAVCVFIPEYVVGHWWERLLHNQSALRLKARLHYRPGIMVTSVPWRLPSAAGRPEPPEHRAVNGRRGLRP
ncbi:APC family permease [Actinomadura viridis]|uniref:Amino acid transporter n=1 Tax=Actinomadura viridis TaxID=58110 RepID=A0A931DIE0_9ACTN|nr:APC family permease [Actinomadura viridis]MBG6089158.1 amino acid transporter [Actinomadura viridis]